MLSLSLPRPSWAHRMPASIKLTLLVVLSMVLFHVGNLSVLSLALAAVVGLTASLGVDAWRQTSRFLLPLMPMVALLMLFHILFGHIEDGTAISLRLLALVLMANIVTMTTALSDMMRTVERLLSPFEKLGVNIRAMSVAMALVIRFLPVLLQRSRDLFDAWRARSAKSARWNLITPIALSALDDAERVSDALRARGGLNPAERN